MHIMHKMKFISINIKLRIFQHLHTAWSHILFFSMDAAISGFEIFRIINVHFLVDGLATFRLLGKHIFHPYKMPDRKMPKFILSHHIQPITRYRCHLLIIFEIAFICWSGTNFISSSSSSSLFFSYTEGLQATMSSRPSFTIQLIYGKAAAFGCRANYYEKLKFKTVVTPSNFISSNERTNDRIKFYVHTPHTHT